MFYIHFSTSYTKVSIVTLISYMVISLSQYVTPIYGQDISRLVWQVVEAIQFNSQVLNNFFLLTIG